MSNLTTNEVCPMDTKCPVPEKHIRDVSDNVLNKLFLLEARLENIASKLFGAETPERDTPESRCISEVLEKMDVSSEYCLHIADEIIKRL